MGGDGYYSERTAGAGKEDTTVAAATPAFFIKSRLLIFFSYVLSINMNIFIIKSLQVIKEKGREFINYIIFIKN